jgi:hypothetical protein
VRLGERGCGSVRRSGNRGRSFHPSPDGQFLAYASQTAEAPGGWSPKRTIRIVRLSTGSVVFTESGIDAYWSNDGRRLIYMSQHGAGSVTIRHHDTAGESGTVETSFSPFLVTTSIWKAIAVSCHPIVSPLVLGWGGENGRCCQRTAAGFRHSCGGIL